MTTDPRLEAIREIYDFLRIMTAANAIAWPGRLTADVTARLEAAGIDRATVEDICRRPSVA